MHQIIFLLYYSSTEDAIYITGKIHALEDRNLAVKCIESKWRYELTSSAVLWIILLHIYLDVLGLLIFISWYDIALGSLKYMGTRKLGLNVLPIEIK